jgi:predicted nucleotidyltransferase
VRESKPDTAPPALLDEIVGRIVDAVDPETILLFGSAAIGDADPGSDIDLLVVVRDPFGQARSRRSRLKRIRQALAGLGVAKDILLFSVDEVERWRSSPNHIVSRAFRQGRVLYARP